MTSVRARAKPVTVAPTKASTFLCKRCKKTQPLKYQCFANGSTRAYRCCEKCRQRQNLLNTKQREKKKKTQPKAKRAAEDDAEPLHVKRKKPESVEVPQAETKEGGEEEEEEKEEGELSPEPEEGELSPEPEPLAVPEADNGKEEKKAVAVDSSSSSSSEAKDQPPSLSTLLGFVNRAQELHDSHADFSKKALEKLAKAVAYHIQAQDEATASHESELLAYKVKVTDLQQAFNEFKEETKQKEIDLKAQLAVQARDHETYRTTIDQAVVAATEKAKDVINELKTKSDQQKAEFRKQLDVLDQLNDKLAEQEAELAQLRAPVAQQKKAWSLEWLQTLGAAMGLAQPDAAAEAQAEPTASSSSSSSSSSYIS